MFTVNIPELRGEKFKVVFHRAEYLGFRQRRRGKDGGEKGASRLKFLPGVDNALLELAKDRDGVIIESMKAYTATECIILRHIGKDDSGYEKYEEFTRGASYCNPRDNFSNEKGRRQAFQSAVESFAVMWAHRHSYVHSMSHEEVQVAKKRIRTLLWKEYKQERGGRGYGFAGKADKKLRGQAKKEEKKEKQHAGV